MAKRTGNDFKFLLLVAILFAVAWVGSELVRTLRTKTAPAEVEQLLVPLKPVLNTGTLDKLEQKQL